MKTLLYLPLFNLKRCFRKSDLERLREAGCDLYLPQAETPEALHAWMMQHAADCELLITGWGTPPLTGNDLDAFPGLRAIIHAAGSIKRLLPPEVWRRGLRVAGCNQALAIGVAETTLGMIISGLKGFFYSREWTRQGGWSDPAFGRPYPSVRELFGLKVGIVSASKVGRHLLKLLQPYELELYVYDPTVPAADVEALGATPVSLPWLCSQCDVITLHAPALPETDGMISRELIASIRDNAIFINTARGNLVDQEALVEELEKNRFTAFLDVTLPEPAPQDHPLRHLPNVILTSHLSGAVTNGCLRQGRSAVDQAIELLEGQPMEGEIHESHLATIA